MPGLTEKIGFIGGEQVQGNLLLLTRRFPHDQLEVVTIALQLVVFQALAQAPGHQSFLGRAEADSRGTQAGEAGCLLPRLFSEQTGVAVVLSCWLSLWQPLAPSPVQVILSGVRPMFRT